MANRVAFLLGLAVLAFLHHAGAQTTAHTVGGTTGWTIPPGGAAFYRNWAANQTFVVGDTLVFNFPTNAHDVAKVPKLSFDRCDDDNEIGETLEMGPATMNLTTPGEHFFICTKGTHCSQGQKMSVTVAATRPAIPPTSNGPSPTGSPSNPGGSPQLVPPPPPSGSGSHAVVAAVSATVFGVVLSSLF